MSLPQYHCNLVYNVKLPGAEDDSDYKLSIDFVRFLAKELESLQIKCFFYERDATPGGSIFDEFFRGVQTSVWTLIIFTRGFSSHGWATYCQQAALYNHIVKQSGNKVIPLLIDNETLPKEFRHSIPISFDKLWNEPGRNIDNISKLKKTILSDEGKSLMSPALLNLETSEDVSHSRDPVQETVPCSRDPVQETVPCSMDTVQKTVPCSMDTVQKTVPCSRDPVQGGVPCSRDPVQGGVPCSRDPVQGGVPCSRDPMQEEILCSRRETVRGKKVNDQLEIENIEELATGASACLCEELNQSPSISGSVPSFDADATPYTSGRQFSETSTWNILPENISGHNQSNALLYAQYPPSPNLIPGASVIKSLTEDSDLSFDSTILTEREDHPDGKGINNETEQSDLCHQDKNITHDLVPGKNQMEIFNDRIDEEVKITEGNGQPGIPITAKYQDQEEQVRGERSRQDDCAKDAIAPCSNDPNSTARPGRWNSAGSMVFKLAINVFTRTDSFC